MSVHASSYACPRKHRFPKQCKENEILRRLSDVQKRNSGSMSLREINKLSSQVGDISVRLENLFKAMDIKTLFEISQKYSRKDAAKYQNVGKKTLDQLEELLKENGLTWKPNE